MNMKLLLTVSAALLLSACGTSGSLQPKDGQSMPQKGYGQSEEQTSDRLLTTTSQQRPSRSDELLRRSERRSEDPFDLPPSDSSKPSEDEKSDDVKSDKPQNIRN